MKEFTSKEQKELEKNPYTYLIKNGRLRITLEGKQRIMELSEEGYCAISIMKMLGYNIAILGEKRARGVVARVRQQAKSEYGLREEYKSKAIKRRSVEELEELPFTFESFYQLKTEVVYLKQEVEFLKKISSVVNAKKRGE